MELIIKKENPLLKPITQFVELFNERNPLLLESSSVLSNVTVAYQTYGELNNDGTNGILICHALSGSSHAAGIVSEDEVTNSTGLEFLGKYNEMFYEKPGWWDPLIGPGKTFNTDKYFVICPNFLASCYGTTGPSSHIPGTTKKYNLTFPQISVRDMITVQKELLKYLGVNRLKTLSGGSLGGMQVLEWAVMFGDMIDSIIPIATASAHSAWAIGLNDASRSAIKNDPVWNNGDYSEQPEKGLSLARKIAMISYRSNVSFQNKFGRKKQPDKENLTAVESYLGYQGEKFINRFDANTYLYVTEAMDNHDIGRDRGKINDVLNNLKMPALCVGISSDILYPAFEQIEIAQQIPNGEYTEIKSEHGHDSFLIEFDQLSNLISTFMRKNRL